MSMDKRAAKKQTPQKSDRKVKSKPRPKIVKVSASETAARNKVLKEHFKKEAKKGTPKYTLKINGMGRDNRPIK